MSLPEVTRPEENSGSIAQAQCELASPTQVMDLVAACSSFPQVDPGETQIQRIGILETIDMLFSRGKSVIFLQGDEGYGKTTILSQFQQRHPDYAFALYIEPSHFECKIQTLQDDLCNQLHWALYNQELSGGQEVNDSLLNKYFRDLRRKARQGRNEIYYFIIDGLEQLLANDLANQHKQIEQWLTIFPRSKSHFRFLFSSSLDSFPLSWPQDIECHPYTIGGFELHHTKEYFAQLVNNLKFIEDIHRASKRIPSNLAKIRRLCHDSDNIESFIENLQNNPLDLIQMEWEQIKPLNEDKSDVIAVLAFAQETHSVSAIAQILNSKSEKVLKLIQNISFLSLQSQGQVKNVHFVSEQHRRFAREKLSYLKHKATKLTIEYLQKRANIDTQRSLLPSYYEQAGLLDEVLTYLSSEHFAQLININQSLIPVQQQVNIGIKAALNQRRDNYLLQFNMQRAVLRELSGANAWQSEIEARIALDDYESAFSMAELSVLKEDQLHLLAIIARAKVEQGLSPETSLIEKIKQVYSQIDHQNLGKKGYEIASELIHVIPALAVELIKQTSTSNSRENAFDWALAKLSVETLRLDTRSDKAKNTAERLRSQIKDSEALSFSARASLLFEQLSANDIIAKAQRLKDDGLDLLRQWLLQNREREDALEVVEYAFNLAISSMDSLDAKTFREIATPLSFSTDVSRVKRFVRLFDAQIEVIEKLGPTEEYVRILLILAQAESKYAFENVGARIDEIHLRIFELNDLVIKTTCLARLIAALSKIDPKQVLKYDKDKTMYAWTMEELQQNFEELLRQTAEHYEATHGIIRALAKTTPRLAVKFAQSLNIERRRNYALYDFVESTIQAPIKEIDFKVLIDVLNLFRFNTLKDESILKILQRLSRSNEDSESLIDIAMPFIDQIQYMQDASQKAYAMSLAYSMMATIDSKEGLRTNLLKRLEEAWRAVDVGWHRVNVGFEIAEMFASKSSEVAKKYCEMAEKTKDETGIYAHSPAMTYLGVLHLAVRAYSGLLVRNLDSEEDLSRLEYFIDLLPSNAEKIGLWSKLAIYFHANGQESQTKQCVLRHIKPLLAGFSQEEVLGKILATIAAAPALYCAHRNTALAEIEKMSPNYKDIALTRICDYLLRKQFPTEPYEYLGNGYKLNYEEIFDICELIKLLDRDSQIYDLITQIVDSLKNHKRNPYINRQETANIISTLEQIVENQLPAPSKRHIRHDGYKIAALAQIARIKPSTGTQDWRDIIEMAGNVPNVADRAYTLCLVATAIPHRESAIIRATFDKASEIAASIPVAFEKISTYQSLAESSKRFDSILAQGALKKAMAVVIENDNPRWYPVQRKIMDLAYTLDSTGEFAESLVSLVDDDPAKAKTRSRTLANLQRRLEMLKLKSSLANRKDLSISDFEETVDYANAAGQLLGSLNAGVARTLSNDCIRQLIQNIAGTTFDEAYPILSLAVQNTIEQHKHTDDAARRHLRPMYESVLSGVELTKVLVLRSANQLKQAQHLSNQMLNKRSILIHAGERELAIQQLRIWFEESVQEYLKICDPFFGPEELEILQLLSTVKPDCEVQILTSKQHHDQKVAKPWSQTYNNYWRHKISPDQSPPYTEIVIVGTRSGGQLPIHDRWWITKGSGYRFGTSFGSLGLTRDSELSLMTSEEARLREQKIDQYLQNTKREHNGERLIRESFTLY